MMDIKDIKKFCNDPDAWYLVRLPRDATQIALNEVAKAVNKLDVPGRFIVAAEDVSIEELIELHKE